MLENCARPILKMVLHILTAFHPNSMGLVLKISLNIPWFTNAKEKLGSSYIREILKDFCKTVYNISVKFPTLFDVSSVDNKITL